MNDIIMEKLVQKVANMLEEISEINILIRRLTPTQETLNRINERVDAIHTAFLQMEKKHAVDDRRLKELEEQTKLLEPALNQLKEQMKIQIDASTTIANDISTLTKGINETISETKASVNLFSLGVTNQMTALKGELLASIKNVKFWTFVFGIALTILLITHLFK